MNEIEETLKSEFLKEYQEVLTLNALERNKKRVTETVFKPVWKGREIDICSLALSVVCDGYNFQENVITWLNTCSLDKVASSFLTSYVGAYATENISANPHFPLQNDVLVVNWLLAVYFEVDEIEQFYRKQVRKCVTGKEKVDGCHFQKGDYYVSCHVSFIENMLASMDAGELTLVSCDECYDAFFVGDYLPDNPLEKLNDIHLKRATYTGEGFEPFECFPLTVFPIENAAWYRIAAKQFSDINIPENLTGNIINAPYKLEISSPELIDLISHANKACGQDMVKEAFGDMVINQNI